MFNFAENKGLTTKQATLLLKQNGRNVLPESPPPSDLVILVQQLKSPLVYVLLAAGFVTLLLKEVSDSVIILIAVLVNSVLGFIQERKAHKALYALKKLVRSNIEVYRDGQMITIDSELIVVGDLVILNHGDKVPADGLLVDANRLFLQESVLTGESVSVAKGKDDSVYMGTIVASGRGLMRVLAVGKNTKMGQIATKVQDVKEDTPLKIQLNNFSRSLAYLVVILTAFVFVIGIITGRDVKEMFGASVALSVSAIPEGLLVGLTVILAIGMQRILKRNGLVRNLVSAETLGGVTTVCLDKTGTLTEGKMQVSKVVGDEKEVSFQVSVANDLDDPIVISAYDWALKRDVKNKDLIKKYERLDSIPFSPTDRYFASLHKYKPEQNILFVNGAPEFLLNWTNLKQAEKEKIKKEISELTKDGSRLMALIRKNVAKNKTKILESDVKGGFSWVGLVVFTDPIRHGVSEMFSKIEKAGIKPLIITGDYLQTAMSVALLAGLKVENDRAMVGEELEKLTVNQLAERLKGEKSILLFARTTPDQKSKIVEALKLNNEVVAMMGDGVNDAPALKKSDIGVVVGEASDVAKETADLVLLDSKFETVISAIEEGRGIFENIRKVITYLMSSAFNAIIAVSGALVLGLPLPVTAVQILWINLVTDGLPDLALTVDPKRKDLMLDKPRSIKENLLSSWMKTLIATVSLTSGLFTLILFIFIYKQTENLELSQTVAFLSLGMNSLIYVFSTRTLEKPVWTQNLFTNKWLLLAVVLGFVLQITPLLTADLRNFFGTVSVPSMYWLYVFAVSFLTLTIIEILKFANGRLFNKNVY